jgi:hypothetical protein
MLLPMDGWGVDASDGTLDTLRAVPLGYRGGYGNLSPPSVTSVTLESVPRSHSPLTDGVAYGMRVDVKKITFHPIEWSMAEPVPLRWQVQRAPSLVWPELPRPSRLA